MFPIPPSSPRTNIDYVNFCSVFRNGDFRYQGARVLLPRRIMGSWEHVLEIVTEKADLFTPAKRLCTLDGHIVHAVSELQDGGKYVVLEGSKPFQRVPYCTTGDDSRSLMYVSMLVNKHTIQTHSNATSLYLIFLGTPFPKLLFDCIVDQEESQPITTMGWSVILAKLQYHYCHSH